VATAEEFLTGKSATAEEFLSAKEPSAAEFLDSSPNPATEQRRGFLSRVWYGITHPGEIQSSEIPFTQREATAGTAPLLGEAPPEMIPRIGEKGTFTRGISDVVSGLVEGVVTPEGQLLVGAATVPPLMPIVRAATAAIGVKSTMEGFKEGAQAFQTGDREQAGRAVGNLIAGGAMVRGSVAGISRTQTPLTEVAARTSEKAASEAVKEPAPKATEEPSAGAPQAMRAETPGPIEDRLGITPVPVHVIVNHLQGLPSVIEGKLRQASGETMPKTTMANREAGEAGARYGSSQIYGPYAAKALSNEVLPMDSAIDPVQFGAALTEQNLRGRRVAFQRQSNAERAAGNIKESDRLQDMANNVTTMVGQKGVFKDEAALRAFTNHPEVQAAVDNLARLYEQRIDPLAEQAGLDPTQKPEVGDLFPNQKGFINLFVPQEGGVPSTRTVSGVNPIATMKRGTKFQRQRTGASDKYGVNFHDMVSNAYSGFLEVARKNEFDKSLVDSGLAVIQDERPGPDFTFFPYERRTVIGLEDGNLAFRNNIKKNIWVRNDISQEYSTVSNLYRNPFKEVSATHAGSILTRFQMLGILDAAYHTRALLKGIGEVPMTGTISDPVMSTFFRSDLIPKAKRLIEAAFLEPAERQERLASLADIGALSAHQPYSWTAPIKSAVRFTEENVRLALDKIFTDLSYDGRFPDTETARREFVNRGLQYNMRFQGPFVRALRQSTFGPFVTAGRAGLARGLRRYVLMDWASPTDTPSRVWVAANVLSKAAGTTLLVGLLNHLRTGDFGGREGTPLGNVDTGLDDEDGNPLSVPVADMVGNEIRGGKAVGLRAGVTAYRQGLDWDQISEAMVRESVNTILHPGLGPWPQAGATALFGQQIGRGLPETPKVPPGENQLASDLKTAGEHLNPIVAGAVEKALGVESTLKPLESSRAALGVVKGIKSERFEAMDRIVNGSQLKDFADQVAKDARKLPIEERRDFLRDQKDRVDASLQRQYQNLMQRLHPSLLKHE
jgi:hypothetical protein